MIAGLPGTGIGGVFYIASAFFMPIHRLLRGGGHDGRSWRRVAAQGGIALGIMGALFLTGWLLGLLLMPELRLPTAMTSGRGLAASSALGIARWIAVVGTAGLLALLLSAVELASFFARRRRRRSRALLLPHTAPALQRGDSSLVGEPVGEAA